MKKSLFQFLIFHFSLLIPLFATSGCVSVGYRASEQYGGPQFTFRSPGPYCGVAADGEWLMANCNPQDYLSNRVHQVALKIIPILSLPFDVVFDTLLLPYDIPCYFSNQDDMQFWEDVFERNETSLPFETYKGHFSEAGRVHARYLLQWDKQGYRQGDYTQERDERGRRIRERIPYPQGKISPAMQTLFSRVEIDYFRPEQTTTETESPPQSQNKLKP